jgi:hypothetical protein
MHLVGLSHDVCLCVCVCVCVCVRVCVRARARCVSQASAEHREHPGTFCHKYMATLLFEGAVQVASEWACDTITRRRKERDVESLTGMIAQKTSQSRETRTRCSTRMWSSFMLVQVVPGVTIVL